MSNVILLRAPSLDVTDKYESALKNAGYAVVSVPVLETVLTNLGELSSLVKAGPQEQSFGGVIVTSARSCEALNRVLDAADWKEIPFYVVGKATASALRQIFPEGSNIRGESTGTGEKLGKFILDDLGGKLSTTTLLYLTGDKNRDVLPRILSDGGACLRSIQVYETQGSSKFTDDIRGAIDTLPKQPSTWWTVFFAPSAAAFVLPTLRQHFTFPPTKIAAIGPTTSAFLKEVLALDVDAVPEEPTPESLVRAMMPIKDRNVDMFGSSSDDHQFS